MSDNSLNVKYDLNNPSVIEGGLGLSDQTISQVGSWLGETLSPISATSTFISSLVSVANTWVRDSDKHLQLKRLRNYLFMLDDIKKEFSERGIEIKSKIDFEEFVIDMGEVLSKIDKSTKPTRYEYYKNLMIRYLTSDEINRSNIKRHLELAKSLSDTSIKVLQELCNTDHSAEFQNKNGLNFWSEFEILSEKKLIEVLRKVESKVSVTGPGSFVNNYKIIYSFEFAIHVSFLAESFINTLSYTTFKHYSSI